MTVKFTHITVPVRRPAGSWLVKLWRRILIFSRIRKPPITHGDLRKIICAKDMRSPIDPIFFVEITGDSPPYIKSDNIMEDCW